MLPQPPRWTQHLLIVLGVAAFLLLTCFLLAAAVSEPALRDALGRTAFFGSLIVWPAYFAVCVVAISVRVWRHLMR